MPYTETDLLNWSKNKLWVSTLSVQQFDLFLLQMERILYGLRMGCIKGL
jgi:hypothetical protein